MRTFLVLPASVFALLLASAADSLAQAAPDPEQPYLQPAPPAGQAHPAAGAPPGGPASAPAPPASAPASSPGVSGTSPAPSPGQRPPAPPPPPENQAPPPRYASPAPTQHPQPAAEPAYDPYAPPPRPQPEEPPEGGGGIDIPPFSIRLDPLDLLLEGRFGLELEVGVLDFMTVELIPMFFITESPVVLNVFSFVGRDGEVTQHSNGLGPLLGASFGVGFWPSGEAFRGYVIRAALTNYGVEYHSVLNGVRVDTVTYTERNFQVMFGSASRIGPFILSSAFGIGYQLNGKERCDPSNDPNGPGVRAGPAGCEDVQILVESETGGGGVASLVGFLHPFSLVGRLSLGVAFD